MKRLVIFAAFVLAGCSSGAVPIRPHGSDVDAIEGKLAVNPCVRSYKFWTMNYFYDYHQSAQFNPIEFIIYDYGKIRFEYYGVNVVGGRPGRHLYAREPNYGMYIDGHFMYATGIYDLRTKSLAMDWCGWNDDPGARGAR